MNIKFIVYCILYKNVISKDAFLKICKSIIAMLNDVITKTADDIDKDNNGLISVGEILYLFSKVHKHIKKSIKGIK